MDEVEFFILDEADRLLDMGKIFKGSVALGRPS